MKARLLFLCLSACAALAAAQGAPASEFTPVELSFQASRQPTPEARPMPQFGGEDMPRQKPNLGVNDTGLTITAGYGLRREHRPFSFNLVELEVQGDMYLHPQHALTLALVGGLGGHSGDRWVMQDGKRVAFSDSYHHYMVSLMGGYRFTQPITRSLGLELGAKGGATAHFLEVDYGRDWSKDEYKYDAEEEQWKKEYHNGSTRHSSAIGFGYAVYAGLTYSVTPETQLTLGYAYRGTTTQPKPRMGSAADSPPPRMKPMQWHVIRLGVSSQF